MMVNVGFLLEVQHPNPYISGEQADFFGACFLFSKPAALQSHPHQLCGDLTLPSGSNQQSDHPQKKTGHPNQPPVFFVSLVFCVVLKKAIQNKKSLKMHGGGGKNMLGKILFGKKRSPASFQVKKCSSYHRTFQARAEASCKRSFLPPLPSAPEKNFVDSKCGSQF